MQLPWYRFLAYRVHCNRVAGGILCAGASLLGFGIHFHFGGTDAAGLPLMPLLRLRGFQAFGRWHYCFSSI